jgi:signal transduction histidine kinase
VAPFLDDLAMAGRLQAESRSLELVIEPGDASWAVDADTQVLASAVNNLLNNAFKFTPAGGRIVLRALAGEGGRLLIEVEDECGGIPASAGDPFQSFAERRGRDRTGLGLGLSIARKAVRAHGGDIHTHNVPGKGCVFTIDVPLAGVGVKEPAGATDQAVSGR